VQKQWIAGMVHSDWPARKWTQRTSRRVIPSTFSSCLQGTLLEISSLHPQPTEASTEKSDKNESEMGIKGTLSPRSKASFETGSPDKVHCNPQASSTSSRKTLPLPSGAATSSSTLDAKSPSTRP